MADSILETLADASVTAHPRTGWQASAHESGAAPLDAKR
jgi:hypothetical protein